MADIAKLGLIVDSKGVVRATKDLKKLERQGDRAERQTQGLSRSFGGLRTAAIAVSGALAALGVARMITAVADAGLAIDAMNSSLRVATGSAEAAATEMTFLRDVSQELGLDLRTSGDAFASLAAAARGTSLEGQGARDIFVSVSEAMTALGRDTQATEGALRAIEQMISKGNVSAEELRGQLGERLPGAFQLAARAAGVTTQELDKMLRNGEVLAADLLPKLAQELSNTFSEQAKRRAQGLQAEMNRFKNAVFDLQTSGNLDAMADAIRDITSLVKDPAFQQGFSQFVAGTIKLGGFLADRAAAVGALFTDTLEEQARSANVLVEDLERQFANVKNPIAKMRIKEDLIEARIAAEALQKAIWTKGVDPSNETDIPDEVVTNTDPATNPFGPTLNIAAPEQLATIDLIAERYAELSQIAEQTSRQLRTPQQVFQDEIKLLNELRSTRQSNSDEMLISQQTYAAGVEEAQEQLRQSSQQTSTLLEEFSIQAARNMQDSLAEFFMFSEDGFDGLVKSALKSFQQIAANAAATQALNLIAGGLSGSSSPLLQSIGGFFEKREKGGPVNSGQTYLVGERGPELFTPQGSGNIVPNNQLSGGGTVVNVSVNASGVSSEGSGQQGQQLGRLIGNAVRSILIDEKRPGGLLNG